MSIQDGEPALPDGAATAPPVDPQPHPHDIAQAQAAPQTNAVLRWLTYWRVRIAHLVLLPELSPHEAHDLRLTVRHEGALSSGYALMCALSAGIATLGLLQSSTAVVIGAMLISPLMAPIAALGFGFASIDGHRIRDAARVVLIGAAIGVLTGVLITWASPIRNATPEILARTQPTLLDLAVALLSGVAGGYATVIGKGGTAIGVAIATALMPPLATLGYGIGVLQPRFALGALLLFLTNLAAIAFSFAVIARLSGAARPLRRVELTPGYVAVLVAAFPALATPLSMTLLRIAHEASMRSAARTAIIAATGDPNARIAQLDVSWPLFSEPKVQALVITRTYATNAVSDAEDRLEALINEKVAIDLQQVLAADLPAQTRAIVDAAMERTAAGIAKDVPPFETIRASIGLPTQSLWTNRAERMVFVEPVPAPGWSLADYHRIEAQANAPQDSWTVRIVPPPHGALAVVLAPPDDDTPPPEDAVTPALAIWALQRWGMAQVSLIAPDGPATRNFIAQLADAGITARRGDPEDGNAAAGIAQIGVYAPRPTVVAARAAADAAARAAEAKLEAVASDAPTSATAAPAPTR